jgi:hypothetical protein
MKVSQPKMVGALARTSADIFRSSAARPNHSAAANSANHPAWARELSLSRILIMTSDPPTYTEQADEYFAAEQIP